MPRNTNFNQLENVGVAYINKNKFERPRFIQCEL